MYVSSPGGLSEENKPMYPEVRYFPFRIAGSSWFGQVPLAQSLHVGIATSAHEQIHIYSSIQHT